MDLNISGKYRNYIFIAILGIIIIVLITEFSVAGQQDKAYGDNYQRYQQTIQLIKEKKYTEAQQVIAQLDKSSQESHQVIYFQAICAANTGDYLSAAEYMQKVREVRPAYLADQKYLVQYGVILFRLGEYERAKLYLLESKKYNNNLDSAKTADDYLMQIETKK